MKSMIEQWIEVASLKVNRGPFQCGMDIRQTHRNLLPGTRRQVKQQKVEVVLERDVRQIDGIDAPFLADPRSLRHDRNVLARRVRIKGANMLRQLPFEAKTGL